MTLLLFCLLHAHQITLPYCVNSVLNRQIHAEVKQPALLLHSCLLLQLYLNNYCCFISPLYSTYHLSTNPVYLSYALHNLEISHHTGDC